MFKIQIYKTKTEKNMDSRLRGNDKEKQKQKKYGFPPARE